MIVRTQKPLEFINKCRATFDPVDLKKAILWYTKKSKPVAKLKTVFMHGRYPAISIHDEKIHCHRLIMHWVKGRVIDGRENVHHINGDRLNFKRENLKIMVAGEHQRQHLRGKPQNKEFVRRRIAASIKKRWPINESPDLLK